MNTSVVLKQVAGYGTGLLSYAFTLIGSSAYPAMLTLALQSDRPFLLLLSFITVFLSFCQTHRTEPYISFALTLVLFSIPLTVLWNTGNTKTAMIGGMLPWSDSYGYFRIAHNLLDGIPVSLGFIRPLFPGFLALLFGLTQRNIMLTQVLLTLGIAVACFLASREIWRTHGSLPAAIALMGIFQFYTVFAGSLVTETLGFMLGGLSFAVLWRGASQQREGLVLLGIFLLTLALCARMGAFGIVPLLLLWGAYQFRTHGWFSKRFLLGGSALVAATLGFNSWLAEVISNAPTLSFGNYALVLYGLLTGGTWQSAFQNYPELQFENPVEQAQYVYGLCWEIMQQNPLTLLQGSLRAWGGMMTEGTERLSGILFHGFGSIPVQLLTNGLVRPLLILGLGICTWYGIPRFHRIKQSFQSSTGSPVYGLLLVYGLGTLLSTPLAPLWDAAWRPYAATMFGNYAVIGIGAWGTAVGVSVLWKRLWLSWGLLEPKLMSEPGASPWSKTFKELSLLQSIPVPEYKTRWLRLPHNHLSSASLLGILLAAAITIGPLALKTGVPPDNSDIKVCPPSLQGTSLFIHPKSVIHLHEDAVLRKTRLPNIRLIDFREGLQNLPESQVNLQNALAQIQPGHSLVSTSRTHSRLVLMKTPLMPQEAGNYIVCGKQTPFQGAKAQHQSMFWVESLYPEPLA